MACYCQQYRITKVEFTATCAPLTMRLFFGSSGGGLPDALNGNIQSVFSCLLGHLYFCIRPWQSCPPGQAFLGQRDLSCRRMFSENGASRRGFHEQAQGTTHCSHLCWSMLRCFVARPIFVSAEHAWCGEECETATMLAAGWHLEFNGATVPGTFCERASGGRIRVQRHRAG